MSISKRALWRYVNIKINRIINHYHVFAVITILFDEMIKDFKDGKEIKIFNFGTFSLNKTKPRRYYNVVFKKIMTSKGYHILRFKMSPQIRKKLCENLNIDKNDRND